MSTSPTKHQFFSNWTFQSIINGFIAWLFGVTGPLLIVLSSADLGNLPDPAIISWVFSIYVVGGATTIILSIHYKQPIAFAYTIPGAVLIGTSLMNHSFTDILGAYVLTGILLLIIAVTKTTTLFMKSIPLPIKLGMVSEVLLPFGIDILMYVTALPVVNGLALTAFAMLTFYKPLGRIIPPIIGAIIVACVMLMATNSLQLNDLSYTMSLPTFYVPTFHLGTISELVIPLLITVIAIQNAQGIAILENIGYQPPVESLTTWSGIASIINSFFGGHPASVAGPMTGIVADESSGQVGYRYKSAIVMGALFIIFGLFANAVIQVVHEIPISLIQLLAGLALLNVLKSSLVGTFSSHFQMGALFSFMITLSDFTLLNIGSPFWGLVFGLLFAYIFEREDFRKQALPQG